MLLSIIQLILLIHIHPARALFMASNMIPSPNRLSKITSLRNKYFGLRHGQSLANVAKIISSDPSISTVQHGLSDLGKDQVSSSAQAFIHKFTKEKCAERYKSVAIFTSDFTRARETACIFASTLADSNIPLHFNDKIISTGMDGDGTGTKHDIRLRERFFGDFNGKSDGHYGDVWRVDCTDPDHTEFNCESVNSVVRRTSELILDIEKELEDIDNDTDSQDDDRPHKVILVAHGDVLQILQTAFLKVDGSVHRSLDHLETASVRELRLAQ